MLQMYFDDEYQAQVLAEKGQVSKEDLKSVESRSEKIVTTVLLPGKVRVAGARSNSWCPRNSSAACRAVVGLHGDRHRRRPGTDGRAGQDFTGRPTDDDHVGARAACGGRSGASAATRRSDTARRGTSSHPIRIRSPLWLTSYDMVAGRLAAVARLARTARKRWRQPEATHHGAGGAHRHGRGQRSSRRGAGVDPRNARCRRAYARSTKLLETA